MDFSSILETIYSQDHKVETHLQEHKVEDSVEELFVGDLSSGRVASIRREEEINQRTHAY